MGSMLCVFKFKLPFLHSHLLPFRCPSLSFTLISLNFFFCCHKVSLSQTMCTPRTIRDWATCFLACRFPLDEEPDTFCISSAQAPIGTTMVFNSIGDNKKGCDTNKIASRNNKSRREKELIQSSIQSSNIRLEEKEIDDSSWPQFADEDYIVFCLREDGEIHVVKDEKPGSSDHADRMNQSSTRPVNRKLTCGEYAEQAYSSSSHDHHHHHMLMNEDEREIYPTNEATSIPCNKKGKGKWSISMDTWPPSGGFGGDKKNDIEEEEEEEVISNKSSESNDQSDGSSSSFAFPVLCNEGVGSPVQMPKPDALHFRKHKARLHCCRF